jgi:2-C-methyl-D-erythritol 4-phosphate cytidylyltransferase
VGRTVAVILAAGKSVRLNAENVNKVLLPLRGEPIIVRATRTFSVHPAIDEVIVVAASKDISACAEVLQTAGIAADVIPGGPTRHESEWSAIRHLAPRVEGGEIEVLVIHDAARPLYDGRRLAELLEAARESGGAILAVPVDEEEDLAWIHEDRPVVPASTEGIWRAQTPQAFQARALLEAFRRAEENGFEGTDTASTVERAGVPVRVVPGDPSNIKITHREDLILAESILENEPGPPRE